MQQNTPENKPVKRTVLDYSDISEMIPFFKGKEKLCNWLLKLVAIDKVNWIHSHNFDTPGVPFTEGLLKDLNITIKIRNKQVLDNLPEGAFITVSNHPFGALDGIMLINIVGKHRPDFKVMVNMILNHITAMRPNFINVDALASNDPKKRAESVRGIATAIRHVREGHPLGFFPAGAVSKFTKELRIEDREWQPSITRIIQKVKVPVIPIYFHGHNSLFFTILGMIDWRLRTLKLPSEVFRGKNRTYRISVGDTITPEMQAQFATPEELGKYLRNQTYALRSWSE